MPPLRLRARGLAAAVALVSSLAGCASSLGPRTVAPARFDYNQALSASWNEQMLLNLVRLRYRDTPVFLEVGAVLAQYSMTGAGSAAVNISGAGEDGNLYGIGGAVEYNESPTITYTPLQGEDFVRRLLTPISPATVLLLSQSGWSIERLMLCCVNRLNDLPNAPAAAGPTPDYTPAFEDFQRLARLLRELQVAGYFNFRIETGDGEDRFLVEIVPADDPVVDAKAAEVAEILGVERGQGAYRLVDEGAAATGDLVMTGRSLVGVFFYLSQAVAVPGAHLEAGWVTRTRRPDGTDFDWNELTGRLFRVETSPERPADAFVAVPYRGHWFYIPDSDLDSKTTFGLLTLLFSLQASGGDGVSPLLTVSTGR